MSRCREISTGKRRTVPISAVTPVHRCSFAREKGRRRFPRGGRRDLVPLSPAWVTRRVMRGAHELEQPEPDLSLFHAWAGSAGMPAKVSGSRSSPLPICAHRGLSPPRPASHGRPAALTHGQQLVGFAPGSATRALQARPRHVRHRSSEELVSAPTQSRPSNSRSVTRRPNRAPDGQAGPRRRGWPGERNPWRGCG
jgi:hypothetical protein